VLVHQETAHGSLRMTFSKAARVESSDGHPLLQGDDIYFDLIKAQGAQPDEQQQLTPTAVLAEGNAVLDVSGSHIEGRRVHLERRAALNEVEPWDVTVNDAIKARIMPPAGSPEASSQPIELIPRNGPFELHRAGGSVDVSGRVTARIFAPDG